MSEKDQSKRGILASLLGLFGEEDEENAGKQTGFESLERPPVTWTEPQFQPESAPASGPASGPESEPASEPEPEVPAAQRYESPPLGPEERPVVRESYEPGWYAVSTSQWARPGEEAPAEAPPDPVKRFVPGDVLGGSQVAPGPQLEAAPPSPRSEEHTSELQSHVNLVCRLLLE